LGAYVAAPPLAWSGWRLRIPGGPEGGQYHGFIGPNSKGFRTNDLEEIGFDAPHGEEGPPPVPDPYTHWQTNWGGTALSEGENPSDYVFRGPAEMRPRANASGGANAIRAFQEERTAGFAEAPGNYRALGAVAVNHMMPASPRPGAHVIKLGPIAVQKHTTFTPPGKICPAWGCGSPPVSIWTAHVGPGPTSTVAQPPPPTYPVVAPTVAGQCPSGEYRDAAGNCTSDWHNPYSLYLPDQSGSPAPAPTVAANTCPTGYSQDPNTGNCVLPGASGTGLSAWLAGSTTLGGIQIPNALLAGVGGLLAFRMMRK
jgi:hypothetical protein